MIAVDKENEIDRRRRELAKQKELREKQAKEEVSQEIIHSLHRIIFFNLR